MTLASDSSQAAPLDGLTGARSLQVAQETFESLDQEWRALLPGLCFKSPFHTPAWLRVWWDHFGKAHEPLLLSFRDGGRLRGIAPLMRSSDRITFLALSDVCDYHDFLFPCGEGEAFLSALLDKLQTLEWSALRLEGLRDGSAALTLLPALAEKRGFSASVAPEEVSPHIPVAASWDAYLGALSKKDRHELRRKMRRLEGEGSVKVTTATSATLASDVARFLELLKDSREEKAAFLTLERERFFHNLAIAMDREGHLKLFFLELDGLKVAAAFVFDYANAYYLYNSGYDKRYESLSVGLLLKALLVQDAIEHGKREYDLLRGAETYKYHLGAQDRWLKTLIIERKGSS